MAQNEEVIKISMKNSILFVLEKDPKKNPVSF